MRTIILRVAAAAAFSAALASPALADTPGRHPHYVHAISDLRHARTLLWHADEPNVWVEQYDAVGDIDRAIRFAGDAARDDRKDVDDSFPVDGSVDRHGRFVAARSILEDALRDLQMPEWSGPDERRDRDAAIEATRAAIHRVTLSLSKGDDALARHWRDTL